ncbi:MAG TPA: S41 family peptidase [Candidatus Nanopelagicaceae bacterium]|nr:S41 family peptidase [Candidatus Nanopelagicaceae bacterium]
MSPRSRIVATIAVAASLSASYLLGLQVGDRHLSPVDEAKASILARAAKVIDPATLEHAAIEGMLKATGDRWSSFYDAKQFAFYNESLAGRFTGVGIWLRAAPFGGVEVASVQTGSPAGTAGVKSADAIIGIDGTDLSHATVPTVAAALRGADGTPVTLHLVRSGIDLSLTMIRREVAIPDVEALNLPNGDLLIQITAFTVGVGKLVAEELRTHPHQSGVILDLRNNPGGLIEEAVNVAGLFLDGGVVVSYQRRGLDTRVLEANPGSETLDPLVVLVNHQSASAAEVVAGALQDRNRAVIVGSRTYGKGSVQESVTMSDGSSIQITVGKYRTPTGRYIDGVGVSPDVQASDTNAVTIGEAVLKSLSSVSARGGKG